MSSRIGPIRPLAAVLPIALLFSLVFARPVSAQEAEDYPRVTLDGQFRLRGEADWRTAGVRPDFATLSRIRVGVHADLRSWVTVYAQVQDARAWGSETSTFLDGSADLLDLFQGYAAVGTSPKFMAKLGRQEIVLADERLLGPLGWTNLGRSFDGVRLLGEANGVSWTAFAFNIFERDSLLVTGLNPQLNQGVIDDGWLIGGFVSKKFGNINAELTALYDVDAVTDKSYTLNLRVHGRTAVVSYEGAAAYQGGPDRSAYFGSGRLGVAVGNGTIAAQIDYLSGDEDPTSAEVNAFTTLYATNHMYYGIMDYFLAIPLQLDRAGLVDFILRGSLETSTNTTVRLDLHRFSTARKRDNRRELGTELDLIGRWRIEAPATLEGGFGVFVPEDLITDLLPAFSNGKQTTYWGYVQFLLNWP